MLWWHVNRNNDDAKKQNSPSIRDLIAYVQGNNTLMEKCISNVLLNVNDYHKLLLNKHRFFFYRVLKTIFPIFVVFLFYLDIFDTKYVY